MTLSKYLLSAIFIIAFTAVLSEDTREQAVENETKDVTRSLISWLRSRPGGYFNGKQEVRRVDPQDPASMNGVFATRNINKGELLCRVPYFSSFVAEGEKRHNSRLNCDLIKKVVHEFKLGQESEFAPYIRYLEAQKDSISMPSLWSLEGKQMLTEVLGGTYPKIPPLEAIDWDRSWPEDCGEDLGDPLTKYVAMALVQRTTDYTSNMERAAGDLLVPVYDLYNHRNGHFLNTKMSIKAYGTLELKASRGIRAGDQIHTTYNKCGACRERYERMYGTPELFRDYGFVEQYPQIWSMDDEAVQFTLGQKDDEKVVVTGHNFQKGEESLPVLREKMRHLNRFQNIARDVNVNNTIPTKEWNLILAYSETARTAIRAALGYLEEKEAKETKEEESNKLLSISDSTSHYFELLRKEHDDIEYIPDCDNQVEYTYLDYEDFPVVTSQYQVATFDWNQDIDDVCLSLAETLQICSSYRPHYHEFAVHLPSRFIHSVKRVVFVGGGDSMLLHEVLKYPSLELVVGLELDQTVVRQSFKYFHTEPHFDDERVEWWFGDAAKSLLMLPKEYWGSFDLVLVDLSETVMAISVTKHLDIFHALALLLKPDGIMVKNELYLGQLSNVFDYTAQVFYESPKVCRQAMVMGSNKVDFLHSPTTDHDVLTLLYHHPTDTVDRFQYFHDYRVNNATAQGNCNQPSSHEDKQEKNKESSNPGILVILESEGVEISLSIPDLEQVIREIATKEGLTPLVALSDDSDEPSGYVTVILEEGYISARLWPQHKYCGFTIHLWSRYERLKSLESSIRLTVRSRSTSSYRIVAGGMSGTLRREYDESQIGPQISQQRNCETTTLSFPQVTSEDVVLEAVLKESLAVMKKPEGPTRLLLVCGAKSTKKCLSKDLLEEIETTRSFVEVVPIYTCLSLEATNGDNSTNLVDMYQCEKDVIENITVASKHSTFDMVWLDKSTSLSMIQIMNSIWGSWKNRKTFLQRGHAFVSLIPTTTQESALLFQKHLLEHYHSDSDEDTNVKAQFSIESNTGSYELGIVLAGVRSAFHELQGLESSLVTRLKDHAVISLPNIQGGRWEFDHDLNKNEFTAYTYDSKKAKEQFMKQVSLGRQTVLQMELGTSAKSIPSMDVLGEAMHEAMLKAKSKGKRVLTKHLADGAVSILLFERGDALLLWDGQRKFNLILYFEDDTRETVDTFIDSLMKETHNELNVILRDDQPRGIHHVINFSEDRPLLKEFAEKYFPGTKMETV